MSIWDLVCFGVCLAGVVLFLYGANYFDAVVGWAGVSLVIAGVAMEIVLTLLKAVRKKGEKLEVVER